MQTLLSPGEIDDLNLRFERAKPADIPPTLEVDVSDYLEQKRSALACHRSQVTDIGFFLQMPIDVFREAFGSEWFIEHDASPPMRIGWLFDRATTDPGPSTS